MSFADLASAAAEVQQAAVNHVLEHREQDAAYARYSGPEGYYAEVIPPLFAPWIDMPDPSAYDPLINDIASAMGKLATSESNTDPRHVSTPYLANPDLSLVKSASDNMQYWTGRAAIAFKQGFLDKVPALLHNHFTLLAAAKAALEAHQDMWAHARTNILDIAGKAVAALEHDACCWGSTEWSFNFTALAAALAVLSVPLDIATDGLAIPLTLAIVGNAAQIAASDPPKESGKTAMQIISSMEAAIQKLHTDLGNAERDIAAILDSDVSTVNGNRSKFVLNRPALAGATSTDVTGPAYMGDYES